MLMSSPMTDTEGGDVAMAAITDMTEGLAMTSPKSAFVNKRCRTAVTRRRSNTGRQRPHLSPAYKRPTSEGRSIFDADLSVPLHDRLMAKRLENCEAEEEKGTEINPASGCSVIVTEAVVHSVVACCLASNVLSPLSFMPVADEKFETRTSARCIADCGPTSSRDDCGPTPVRFSADCGSTVAQCIRDCGPTPDRCSADRGLDLQTCQEEKANQHFVGETMQEDDATATTLQADFADWEPEASVKLTLKRKGRRQSRDNCGTIPARCSVDRGLDLQTCREEKANPDLAGETLSQNEGASTTLQANLADWDPEACVKSTRRKRGGGKRRDTGNFLMIHMNRQTLSDEGLSTPEQTGSSPSEGVRFKARRSRRLRRKSMRLQTVAPPVVTEQTVDTAPVVIMEQPDENAVVGIDETTFVLSCSPSAGATCVAVEDSTIVSLCSPRQCEVTPSDIATADTVNEPSVTIDEHQSPVECFSVENHSLVESLSFVAPPQTSQDSAWVSDRRPSRRCTQKTRIVDVDSPSPPKAPKKRGRKGKQGKTFVRVSLDDIYNNRLWRSQMPETGKRWTTIAEENDSSGHSTGAAASRTVDKPRTLEVSDFYSKTRMAKRRQKARRTGWKPPRKKKLGEQTVMDELLESKLRALDDELLRVDH